MNTFFTSALFIAMFLSLQLTVSGSREPSKNQIPDDAKTNELKSTTAACLPSSAWAELNIGGVRARINNGGDMWWDLTGTSQYEVPKGSGRNGMYAGALWIGGVDNNNNLRLAAQMYRSKGDDFWPGPLTDDGTFATDATVCLQYDNIQVYYRQDIVDFLTWWDNPSQFPNYTIPGYFLTYPAHGNPAQNQSYYLAPFYDNNHDGNYNPYDGDYPYYDIYNRLCGTRLPTAEALEGGNLADQVLKGDQTLWWVFNDKGNIHSETGGKALGIEVRAQAFAFATNDEINQATFYTYEIINRSNTTLYETHVGLFSDPDNGSPYDNYVGCDVPRGLGYCYNGDDFDENSSGGYGYGDRPAAIGVDFLQGPYMDPDGIDNSAFAQVTDSAGNSWFENCNEAVNGVNFGNGVIDDERFGMNHFVDFCCSGVVGWYMTSPEIAAEYYKFMTGFWKDDTHMIYGGNGHSVSGGYGPACNFMFPGESDLCNYGTGGIAPYGPKNWTEATAGNQPYGRRFAQTAGPFTMHPGAVNYLTVAVPWARATSGSAAASLNALMVADDKCQALFDNCFKILDGPAAPDVTAQELDKEIILYLSNDEMSNNYQDKYSEVDPAIVSLQGQHDSLFRFEGYQIFQVSDLSVTMADLYDPDKARLVAQCDVQNDADVLVNYTYSVELNAMIPHEEVHGENAGITHSFRILEDQFATGQNKRLINNKKYYYLAIAYAYNEYEKYSDNPAYQFPGVISSNGQKTPYLPGRNNIQVYTCIPRIPVSQSGGTQANSGYGDQPAITRIEGQGNGGNILELTKASRDKILHDYFSAELTYEPGAGPVTVTVIDPLNVKPANYVLKLDSTLIPWDDNYDACYWTLEEYDLSNNLVAVYHSDNNIVGANEQVFPELGIAVTFVNGKNSGDPSHPTNGFLEATIEYSDPAHAWLGGVADMDGPTPYNWIRSGELNSENGDYSDFAYGGSYIDPQEHFEKILGGTWAPYRLASFEENNPALSYVQPFLLTSNKMTNLASVDIILTPDKSKWTRCPVLETCEDKLLSEGGADKLALRAHASVDKNGNTGTAEATFDGKATGMGWFPGYAINIETGERLNMAFGEDSWLGSENGDDMLFNPTSNLETTLGVPLFGGKHFVYVFGHNGDTTYNCPAYDGGAWLHSMISNYSSTTMKYAFQSAMWCSIPLSVDGENWLSNECRVRLRVSKAYNKNYSTYGSTNPENKNLPMYRFNTLSLFTDVNNTEVAKSALDLINVVPNPYYALNDYEESIYENKVKITNVPSNCTVSIFNIQGTLVRKFVNDDPFNTTIDWDLRNASGKLVSGGVYIIHVKAPGIGERTIKWFGSMKTVVDNEF